MDYIVTKFGALGDGISSCTQSFKNAVEACAASGGGHVIVPAGKYLCATIKLQSNVYLMLEPGAVILADKDFSLFEGTKRGCAWYTANKRLSGESQAPNPCKALVIAEDSENCGIIGEGCLDGQRGCIRDPENSFGSLFLVVFSHCSNVTLEGITMRDPGMFTVYMLACSHVQIHRVKIFSENTVSGDGLDFDGGRHVTISDCILHTGDDGIGLKTLTPHEPCEDFTITNCQINAKNWGAVRIGPESAGDMRRIVISNCIFDKCNDGFKLQICDNVIFEDFTFSNIQMNHVVRPFFITSNRYAFSSYTQSLRPECGIVRRIAFSNIQAVMEQRENHYCDPCSIVCGLEDAVIEDISFSDVCIKACGGGIAPAHPSTLELVDYTQCYPEEFIGTNPLPAAHMYIKNVNNISFYNCRFICEQYDSRFALVAENVDSIVFNCPDIRNTAGLLHHIECPEIKGYFPDNLVQAYDENESRKWYKLRQQALKLCNSMELAAKLYDNIDENIMIAEKAIQENCQEVSFNINSPKTERCILLCPSVKGSWRLCINASEAAVWDMPSYFMFFTPWIIDIKPFLSQGKNTVTLLPADKESKLAAQTIKILSC